MENNRIEEMFDDINERADEVAIRAEAIERLTRESIVADNRKFRKRNNVLLTVVLLLLFSQVVQQVRYYTTSKPQTDRIEHAIKAIDVNQASLDQIIEFIEHVEASNEDAISREELEAVFEAIYETRDILLAHIEDG